MKYLRSMHVGTPASLDSGVTYTKEYRLKFVFDDCYAEFNQQFYVGTSQKEIVQSLRSMADMIEQIS